MHAGRHRGDDEHADRDAQDRERRAYLVRANGVERDQHALAERSETLLASLHQSLRSARMGSSRAARLAG